MSGLSVQQRDQPAGVPPLRLTGERTMPDVPAENYWFRRHLAVYEWIARREAGAEVVIDMACGEGYGADLLARGRGSVIAVEADPEAHEHARLRYRRPNLRFAQDRVESFAAPAEAIVFLQTIEHLQDPRGALEGFRSLIPGEGRVYVSTPNRLTFAPAGAERSDNPFHVREHDPGDFSELLRGVFSRVQLWGLFHARKLRWHEIALGLGWEAAHRRLGLTGVFYDRFIPAVQARDFKLLEAPRADLDRALDLVAVCRP